MKTRKWFYYLLAFWLILVMAFGLWWLYLLFKLGTQLKTLEGSGLEYSRLIRMLDLEGTTFIFVLFAGGLFAGWVYLQDLKKSRSIQAFFSSLTHELKTPLASMRLQAEVIDEIKNDPTQSDKLSVLVSRLIEDSQSLETQMDKALQLARLEQGGTFPLKHVDLNSFFKRILYRYKDQYEIQLSLSHPEVLADEFALELIFKNFIENTKRHQPSCKLIQIKTIKQSSIIKVVYDDLGEPFDGDINKLGKLFYKHNSSQGTGVGLYLSKRLATAMKGQLIIKQAPQLVFSLSLKEAKA